jgi:hypothetical protein
MHDVFYNTRNALASVFLNVIKTGKEEAGACPKLHKNPFPHQTRKWQWYWGYAPGHFGARYADMETVS